MKDRDRKGSNIPEIDDELRRIVDSLPLPDRFVKQVIDIVPTGKQFRAYLEEISKFPVLSANDEAQLIEQARDEKTGRVARRKLNEANLRLVTWIAKEYTAGDAQLNDLINEGTLGLLRSLDTYDPEAGKPFQEHAAIWIRKAISEEVANETRLNRVPDYLLEKVTSIKPISQRLMLEMGREPTREEVASELGLGADELDRLVKLVGHGAPPEEESEESDEEPDYTYDQDIDYD